MCALPTRYQTEDRILFQTVARAIISDTRGALEDQIKQARLWRIINFTIQTNPNL